MQLDTIPAREASALIAGGEHYLGPLEYTPTLCIATPERDALAVFGPPIAQHFKVMLSKPLELTRLWQSQARRDSGKPLSQFLGSALRWLRKLSPHSDCVFSYADPHRSHKGTIYKACNFTCFGESRVTDYWLDPLAPEMLLSSPKMYRRHKTKSREALMAVGYELIERPPKILYVRGLRRTVEDVRNIIGGRYAE